MVFIKKSEAGFTIIEVMIAVLILAIGLLSTAAMQTRAVEQANSANRLSERVTVCEEWMEDLMSLPIRSDGDIDPDPLFSDPDINNGTWQNAPEIYSEKNIQTEYRVTAGYPLENLTSIEVSVIPYGMTESQKEKKRITFPYIRSTRWN
jgi:type IV pilus modification protein PilV